MSSYQRKTSFNSTRWRPLPTNDMCILHLAASSTCASSGETIVGACPCTIKTNETDAQKFQRYFTISGNEKTYYWTPCNSSGEIEVQHPTTATPGATSTCLTCTTQARHLKLCHVSSSQGGKVLFSGVQPQSKGSPFPAQMTGRQGEAQTHSDTLTAGERRELNELRTLNGTLRQENARLKACMEAAKKALA